MSVKITCDVCGKDDIGRDYVSDNLKTHIDRVQAKVMVAIDGIWNGGNICYECLVAHFQAVFSAGENSEAQEHDYHA